MGHTHTHTEARRHISICGRQLFPQSRQGPRGVAATRCDDGALSGAKARLRTLRTETAPTHQPLGRPARGAARGAAGGRGSTCVPTAGRVVSCPRGAGQGAFESGRLNVTLTTPKWAARLAGGARHAACVRTCVNKRQWEAQRPWMGSHRKPSPTECPSVRTFCLCESSAAMQAAWVRAPRRGGG